MIETGYVREMARYNAWQNKQVFDFIKVLPEAELTKDRGAFFGSILATLNHLLWGDTIWMSRFDPSIEPPDVGIPESTTWTANAGDWSAARFRMDGKIKSWADRIHNVDLQGELTWYSGATGKTQTKPLIICIIQLFNHQTHHRGQVHAMLTALGSKAPVSDIPFRPEE